MPCFLGARPGLSSPPSPCGSRTNLPKATSGHWGSQDSGPGHAAERPELCVTVRPSPSKFPTRETVIMTEDAGPEAPGLS